ncbi:MAG: hypothetical protein HQ523_11910 [Lentisphaerae bacterium]|nr:hypothetical protein [Lentisphaerota bacterium]
MSEVERERNLGEQPISAVLEAHGLSRHDVVAASAEPITHKMVARACKGRRLTHHSRHKILRAVCAATQKECALSDLFNY